MELLKHMLLAVWMLILTGICVVIVVAAILGARVVSESHGTANGLFWLLCFAVTAIATVNRASDY